MDEDLQQSASSKSSNLGGFHRVEYSVATQASVELCWETYIDWRNWPKFHPSYGNMEWSSGRPWDRGSRLSIEIVSPVHIQVEHVITAFVPRDRIAWIDHAGYITVEQWVFFRKRSEGGSTIETWADLVGPATIKGALALPIFKQFTKKWYNEFALYCDGLAGKS